MKLERERVIFGTGVLRFTLPKKVTFYETVDATGWTSKQIEDSKQLADKMRLGYQYLKPDEAIPCDRPTFTVLTAGTKEEIDNFLNKLPEFTTPQVQS